MTMDWIGLVFLVLAILMPCFWLAQFLFVRSHLRWSARPAAPLPGEADISLSWIHPIKDLDYKLRRSLSSWFRQDFGGTVQHLFSFQDPDDAAIPVVRAFLASRGIGETGRVSARILVHPLLPRVNGKSSNMIHGVRAAAHDLLVFNDSDIRVRPDFLRKMAGPLLADTKVGIVTCGQVNFGGRDFWTRMFTAVQNHETDYYWAFLCRLGMDVGMTGAAFSMRREVLQDVGGLEAYGASLLEDMHIGNEIYRKGYRLVLGPFVDCHVHRIAREKTFNYAKRIAVGIRAHIATDLPLFLFVIGWYLFLLLLAAILGRADLLLLMAACVVLRLVHGNVMRLLTRNDLVWYDLANGLLFDLMAIGAMAYSLFARPVVSWRGIRYRVTRAGFIDFDHPIPSEGGTAPVPVDIASADLDDRVEVEPQPADLPPEVGDAASGDAGTGPAGG